MEINEPAVQYGLNMSPNEYLIWEREQQFKNEYIGGKVVAMAGASI
jgi:hypothetical protein